MPGMEMMTKSFAEENRNNKGFKSLAFGPGVVDTNMQVQLRGSRQEDFSRVQDFIQFKEKGHLNDPSFVAEKILDFLIEDRYISGSSIDISKS